MTKQRESTSGGSSLAENGKSASEHILGRYPFLGLRGGDVLESAGRFVGKALQSPALLLEREAQMARELLTVLSGRSELAPEAGDKRFADEAWRSNPFYRLALQSHLGWSKALGRVVDHLPLGDAGRQRANFFVSLISDALAPTNTLLGNPAALKRFLDTGGTSAAQGLRNMLQDLFEHSGMPTQTDMKAFKVGESVAVSPGSVVFRNDVLELLQYAPKTDTVHARPLLMVPPQVNKFYIYDLSPGKSIVEFLVGEGFRTFCVSWRNPTAKQRDWNMDTYVAALLEAIDAVRDITGARNVNVQGACAGAMTVAALLGHLNARRRKLVHSATLMVAVLDGRAESQLGMFATPESVAAAKLASRAKGVLEGQAMGRMFAWMRPNDLVWNYWVNNYLMGNPPPVFDILYWNNDTTRLSAAFHGQLMDSFVDNAYSQPGAITVLGTPIDLSRVDCDKYLVAGITDHIAPWKGVFNTSRTFGGSNEFILSSSGHIQSLINPPGNPKSKFWVNPSETGDPEEWLAAATLTPGTWWNHWSAWLAERSGPRRKAKAMRGSARFPVLGKAPGRYVQG